MAIIIGTEASETLDANDGVTNLADEIFGLGGNDEIFGLDNFDIIHGGAGADLIDGGNGFDISDYTDSGSAVFVSLLTGSGVGGTANGDTLLNIEAVRGSSFEDFLVGDDLNNSLSGNDAKDLLQGKGGDDQLHGDLGDDIIDGGDGDDSFLDGGDGNDNVDGGSGTDRVVGNQGNDTLSGDDGNDSLEGRQGFDSINGGTGIDNITGGDDSDTINGGTENDRITGDDGADSLAGGDGDDFIEGGPGADVIEGGSGIDIAHYGSSGEAIRVRLGGRLGIGGEAAGDTLVDVENITGGFGSDLIVGDGAINRLEGNQGDDTIRSGAGADVLNGNHGSDVLEGGPGADQIRGGASFVDFPDTGVDLVSYSGSKAAVTVNLALNTFEGGDAAGDTVIEVEGVTGSDLNDLLIGAATSDRLNGGSGNDFLGGSASADQLIGGAGVDTVSYSASTAAVTVNLQSTGASGGDAQGDTVSRVENVVGSAFSDALLGDSSSNQLRGRSGSDFLAGRDGNDLLAGGVGADEIAGGAGLDTTDYSTSSAAVRVNLSLGTAAGGHAEGDALSGIERIRGSAFNDVLIGSAIGNILTGGPGRDRLTGGGGGDRFDYNAVTESGVTAPTQDQLEDFTVNRDRIDFSTIDAVPGGANDVFTFRGTTAFTAPGQVHVAASGANTIVEVNVVGASTADMSILLIGVSASKIDASDFVL